MGAAEVLILVAVVVALFWALTPLRRRLESWLARRLPPARPQPRRRVVVLGRRTDGTYAREDRDER